MKRIVVTAPYGQQITEDRWIKKHISKEFDEDSTVGDILRFIDTVKDSDISSSIITVLSEPYRITPINNNKLKKDEKDNVQ